MEGLGLLRALAVRAGAGAGAVPASPPFPSDYLADLVAVAAIEGEELEEYFDELDSRFRGSDDGA